MMEFVSDDEIRNCSWKINSMVPVTTNQVRFLVAPYMVAEKGQPFLASLDFIPLMADDHIHGGTSYLLVGETVENIGKTKKTHFLQGFPHFSASSSSSTLSHTLWGLLPFFTGLA
jgi:hypothetical protein